MKIQTDQCMLYQNVTEYGKFDWLVWFFIFPQWDKQPKINCTHTQTSTYAGTHTHMHTHTHLLTLTATILNISRMGKAQLEKVYVVGVGWQSTDA